MVTMGVIMSDQSVSTRYSVQVGAFRTEAAANSVANPLVYLGYPVRVIQQDGLYFVLVGDYPLLSEATEAEQDLNLLGYETLIKEFEQKELPNL
ncbi:MAG: SPOR domain-containing protein [Clostridiales bacterium]|nr:SPOR domain-containing protein [Clostridiales bacterium]